MVADTDQKTPNNVEIPITIESTRTLPLDVLRHSVNELQRKQVDIHRHIGQLSSVMADFEYHMARVRHACSSTTENNQQLCQSLLSHLDAVVSETRSALVASTAGTTDAQQVQDLVHRLYEENQRIANHIEYLIEENPPAQDESSEEDHVQKAIEQIELAFEQNLREQERLRHEQNQFENNQKTMETFIQSTDDLHSEALKKLRQHIRSLREQNQSLKQYNEQIDLLSKQLPHTLLLSSE